jgi:ribosome-associated protein
MEDPLRIGRHAAVPLSEIELRTSRSSGPGGQHANVTASRVEAVFDVGASRALTEAQRKRIAARLGPVVRAVAQDTRSQTRNRELALERLRGRLEGALAVQRTRRATKPTAASRRRRAESKRRRAETKRLRRRPDLSSEP